MAMETPIRAFQKGGKGGKIQSPQRRITSTTRRRPRRGRNQRARQDGNALSCARLQEMAMKERIDSSKKPCPQVSARTMQQWMICDATFWRLF
jgi:hypothetical protein